MASNVLKALCCSCSKARSTTATVRTCRQFATSPTASTKDRITAGSTASTTSTISDRFDSSNSSKIRCLWRSVVWNFYHSRDFSKFMHNLYALYFWFADILPFFAQRGGKYQGEISINLFWSLFVLLNLAKCLMTPNKVWNARRKCRDKLYMYST